MKKFIAIQITLLVRYIVKDEVDTFYFTLSFSFLALPIIIYIFGKYFAHKEESYKPSNIEHWSFYTQQKVFSNKKPIYKGNEQRGYFQRYFLTKFHFLVNELLGDSFYLTFKLKIDEQEYDVQSASQKRLSNQSYWHIYKNGELIGQAKTVVDLKNTMKLTEVIEAQFGDVTYTTSASTMTSSISLQKDGQSIGRCGRDEQLSHLIKNIKVIELQNDEPEQLITLLLHAFYFKNNS